MLGLADRGGDVGAGDPDAALLVEADRMLARELAELVAVRRAAPRAGARARSARGTSRRCRGSGSRAARRGAARPCSCRPPPARRWRRSSLCHRVQELEESGEAYRRPPPRPRPRRPRARRARRPRPSIAIRWSPCELIPPPLGRVGTPLTPKPSSRRRDADAKASERSCHGLDAVGLLHAQLLCASRRRLSPRAHPGGEREQRQLVDQPRHLLGGRRWSRSARRSAPRGRRPARRRACAG